MSKKCGCGKPREQNTVFFSFEDGEFEIKRYYGCTECFVERNLWCEEHGACFVTNEPVYSGQETLCRVDGEHISACFSCIEDFIFEIQQKHFNEYVLLLQRRASANTQKFLDQHRNSIPWL